MKSYVLLLIILLSFGFSTLADGTQLEIEFSLPKIDTNPYHRPYVAVWLETVERKGVHTFAFWHEQDDWFKDLRQWWRKVGRRHEPNYDGVSGATRKPGNYRLTWQGALVDGLQVEPGNYILHFESVREEGSREYLRQSVSLGEGKKQSYVLQGKTEFGTIKITIE